MTYDIIWTLTYYFPFSKAFPFFVEPTPKPHHFSPFVLNATLLAYAFSFNVFAPYPHFFVSCCSSSLSRLFALLSSFPVLSLFCLTSPLPFSVPCDSMASFLLLLVPMFSLAVILTFSWSAPPSTSIHPLCLISPLPMAFSVPCNSIASFLLVLVPTFSLAVILSFSWSAPSSTSIHPFACSVPSSISLLSLFSISVFLVTSSFLFSSFHSFWSFSTFLYRAAPFPWFPLFNPSTYPSFARFGWSAPGPWPLPTFTLAGPANGWHLTLVYQML